MGSKTEKVKLKLGTSWHCKTPHIVMRAENYNSVIQGSCKSSLYLIPLTHLSVWHRNYLPWHCQLQAGSPVGEHSIPKVPACACWPRCHRHSWQPSLPNQGAPVSRGLRGQDVSLQQEIALAKVTVKGISNSWQLVPKANSVGGYCLPSWVVWFCFKTRCCSSKSAVLISPSSLLTLFSFVWE